MCFNSSKYHFDFPSLLTRDGSEQYRSPPITINAVLAWLHDKYQNVGRSCLRRGLTGGESKNSAKINPQSNAD